jgi:EpsI family protein
MSMTRRVLILFGCLLVSAGVIVRADRAENVPPRRSLERLPLQIGRWAGQDQTPFSKDILAILGVDDYITRSYFTPEHERVGLYIGYYGSQRQGDTMHSPQNCLPGAGWEPLSHQLLTLTLPASTAGQSRAITVNRYTIQKGLDRQLVLYWYQAHGRIVASEYWGKLYLVADAFRLNRTDGALVRIIVPAAATDNGEAVAHASAVNFVGELFPHLSEYLPD